MEQFAPCPQCGQSAAKPVNFTWWGGVLGPKLLSQVKCQACRKTYNGKTGKDNTKGIIIYSVVGMVVAFILFFALFFFAGLTLSTAGR